MSQVYLGINQFSLVGVDAEFIQFVFDVTVGLAKLNPDSEAGLVITDDDHMQSLNNQYRGKDKPTNVLSFGYLETSKEDKIPNEDKHYLGDVYVSYSIINKEAGDMGITPKARFTHLFVHGLLHLAGMHHDTKVQQDKMEELEDKILTAIADTE